MLSQAVRSVVGESGRHNGDGEDQEDGKDGVGDPLGTAFVGVDIDIGHVSVVYLGVRVGRLSGVLRFMATVLVRDKAPARYKPESRVPAPVQTPYERQPHPCSSGDPRLIEPTTSQSD